MAVPSSIVLTPNNADVGDLPLPVSVTATDIFERPNSTGDYDFSIVDSDWKGGSLQGDGFIGHSFVGDGVDSYIDLTSQIPTINKFFGVSIWVYNFTSASTQRIIKLSPSTGNGSFDILKLSDGTFRGISYGPSGIDTNRKFTTSIDSYGNDVWVHIFAYVDLNSPTDPLKLIINGVDNNTIGDNDSFSSFIATNRFEVGAGYYEGTYYNYFDGAINDLYWSTNSSFASDVAKYSNVPITQIDTTGISPTRYISETEYEVTVPATSAGVKDFDITNSSGTGSTTFEVLNANVQGSFFF